MKLFCQGVGSNYEREYHIRECLSALESRFAPLSVSATYASAPVDGTGAYYFNLVVGFDCGETVETLFTVLKSIETALGRVRAGSGTADCAIDIDLLLYGDLVTETDRFTIPRADVLRHAHVLRPLAELAPRERHPVTGEAYLKLWHELRPSAPRLRKIDP